MVKKAKKGRAKEKKVRLKKKGKLRFDGGTPVLLRAKIEDTLRANNILPSTCSLISDFIHQNNLTVIITEKGKLDIKNKAGVNIKEFLDEKQVNYIVSRDASREDYFVIMGMKPPTPKVEGLADARDAMGSPRAALPATVPRTGLKGMAEQRAQNAALQHAQAESKPQERIVEEPDAAAAAPAKRSAKKPKTPFEHLRPETQQRIKELIKNATEGQSMSLDLRTARDVNYYLDDIRRVLGRNFSVQSTPKNETYKVQTGPNEGKSLQVYTVTITKQAVVDMTADFNKKRSRIEYEAWIKSIPINITRLPYAAENQTSVASDLRTGLMIALLQVRTESGLMNQKRYTKLRENAIAAVEKSNLDERIKGMFRELPKTPKDVWG